MGCSSAREQAGGICPAQSRGTTMLRVFSAAQDHAEKNSLVVDPSFNFAFVRVLAPHLYSSPFSSLRAGACPMSCLFAADRFWCCLWPRAKGQELCFC